MEISTAIGTFMKHGDYFTVIKMLKETGFTAYDFTKCEENDIK